MGVRVDRETMPQRSPLGWPLQACYPGFRFAHPGYLLWRIRVLPPFGSLHSGDGTT